MRSSLIVALFAALAVSSSPHGDRRHYRHNLARSHPSRCSAFSRQGSASSLPVTTPLPQTTTAYSPPSSPSSPPPSSSSPPLPSSSSPPPPSSSSSPPPSSSSPPPPSSSSPPPAPSSSAAPTQGSQSAPVTANGPFTGGVATFFYQDGAAGACGVVNPDSAKLCAIDQGRFGTNGPASPLCGRQVMITDLNNNKSITVPVADDCPSCENENSIDLSVGAFQDLEEDLGVGTFPISWKFV